VSCTVQHLASMVEPPLVRDHGDTLAGAEGFLCFQRVPQPGDALLVGLSEAVPSNAVLLRFGCQIEGVGVDPRRPPLAWEAWTGEDWTACHLEHDDTGGLNRAGDVVVHVPRGHAVSLINRQRAGWLRCRVTEAEEGQPAYSASPLIEAVSAATIGGTAEAVHAELVHSEVLGTSDGLPGQRFDLRRSPVIAAQQPSVLEVAADGVWQEWVAVEDFAGSEAGDPHFVLDAAAGQVLLGPAVREADGGLRYHGGVPPKGATLRLRSYATGGGRRGNVARQTITVLKSSVPYIARVHNRRAASGGVDPEDLDNAKVRGPILMRTRNRAVTGEDYEHLARQVAPEVARVRCAPAGAGAVRVLVVPSAQDDELGRLRFEQLVPADETLASIARHLDARRVIGSRVAVEPPTYQGITVVARLRSRPRADAERLRRDALAALFGYFHAIRGGPEGRGWPFGRPVHVGEVYAVLQRLPGVEFVEDTRLFAANPVTGERGDAQQRLEVEPHALVFSYEHQVRVEAT